MRDPIHFTFGGQARRVTPALGVTMRIEAETGLGIFELVERCRTVRATVMQALQIITAALAHEGVVYDIDQATKMAENDGLLATQIAAMKIVSGLVIEPKVKKGNGRNVPLERTADAIQ